MNATEKPDKKRVRVAVLVSGGGTNLGMLIKAQEDGALRDGEIVLTVSNKPDVYALRRAEAAGIKTALADKRALGSQEKFEAELLDILNRESIELIVLAGFTNILSADFVGRFPNRIINVHPSLIPAFCGKGFWGLHVHEAALSRGVKITGATVHFVNEITDGGKIIMQKAVSVEENDTPETLQRRVMEEAEWIILPLALQKVSEELRRA